MTGLTCPKKMVFGPCGGVRPDASCEVDPQLPCPFVIAPLVTWTGPPGGRDAPARVPRIMADLGADPYDVHNVQQVAGIVGPAVDALLIGDHRNRPSFSPSFLGAVVQESGGAPWPVLTCRDRSAAALDAELAALAALAIPGVHCVTGDGVSGSTSSGVFELDSLRLTARATGFGLTSSVAATPAAPPTGLRPQRLHEKERAGAAVCIVNHLATHDHLVDFVRASRAAGGSLPFVACVPVFTDEESARVLAAFPGTELSGRNVGVVLGAPDPVEAGIAAATGIAVDLLNGGDVAGVDLSGSVTSGDASQSAAILREIAIRIREQVDRAR